MRFLTILISLIVGIALGIVFLNNAHGVILNLDPFVKPRFPPETPYRVYPLWLVMAACALIGLFLGWLLGLTSGYSCRPAKEPETVKKKAEADYLLIDAPIERRGS